MKKLMMLVLVLMLCLGTAMADMLPADVVITYGDTVLDAPVYTDDTDVYVPLEALMQLLGGSAVEQEGRMVLALPQTAQPAQSSNVFFEDDHITATFNGFEFFDRMRDTNDLLATPKIVIENKTNKVIKYQVDWKQISINGCKLDGAGTRETELAAKSKVSFPAVSYCVLNISDLEDYGETVIRHIEMDVKLTYGKKTKTETWAIDCNVPVESIQPTN